MPSTLFPARWLLICLMVGVRFVAGQTQSSPPDTFREKVSSVVTIVGRLANQGRITNDEYAQLADATIELGQVADKANEGHETQEVVQLARGVLEDGLFVTKMGRQLDEPNASRWKTREQQLTDLLMRLKPMPVPPPQPPSQSQSQSDSQASSDSQSQATQGNGSPQPGMQRVGGAKRPTVADDVNFNAQQKLEQLKEKDKPGELFQRMQTQPTKKAVRDW